MNFLLLTLVLLARIVVASVIKKCCSSCSDPTPCHVSEPVVHIPCRCCRPHKQGSKFPPGLCEAGWTYYEKTGACYKAFFEANFDDAEKSCRMKQGHLASIHSYEENLFVAALVHTGKKWTDGNEYTWIGLKQADYPQNKNWIWTDGTKVDFLTFANGQPDNFGSNEHCTQTTFMLISQFRGSSSTALELNCCAGSVSGLRDQYERNLSAESRTYISESYPTMFIVSKAFDLDNRPHLNQYAICDPFTSKYLTHSRQYDPPLYGDHGSRPYLMWNDAPCTSVMRSFICKKEARMSACG